MTIRMASFHIFRSLPKVKAIGPVGPNNPIATALSNLDCLIAMNALQQSRTRQINVIEIYTILSTRNNRNSSPTAFSRSSRFSVFVTRFGMLCKRSHALAAGLVVCRIYIAAEISKMFSHIFTSSSANAVYSERSPVARRFEKWTRKSPIDTGDFGGPASEPPKFFAWSPRQPFC